MHWDWPRCAQRAQRLPKEGMVDEDERSFFDCWNYVIIGKRMAEIRLGLHVRRFLDWVRAERLVYLDIERKLGGGGKRAAVVEEK